MGSMMPAGPSGSGQTVMSGAWSGAFSDSTGSMMGAGLSPAMMNNATWDITQTGSTFSGTMRFAGYMARGPMTVSGTIAGTTANFTMTIPVGSMMSGACTATATGTFDMDDLMTQMHGVYTGSNTCTGPFDHGQLSLQR